MQISVNGRDVAIPADIDPQTPLLWVLRDTLNIVGPKYGCGIGACGACTVHIDGKATRSCQTAIAKVGAAKVVTIEGLAGADGKLHPLQQAWIDLDVAQCGYCQGGQVMTAAALLRDKPKPTDDEITAAMTGNLCRCATYNRIRAAIHQAAGIKGGAKSASTEEGVHERI